MNEIIIFIKKCLTNFLKEQKYYNDNLISKIIVSKIRIKNQGDFTTNLAFLIHNESKKTILDFSNDVKKYCLTNYKDYFSDIKLVKGFINFYITNVFFNKIIKNILNLKENYGKSNLKNLKYNIEMISANPTGPLHLGHGRNAFITNAICNILKYDGYHITKEYYVNDAGNQINNLALTVYIWYLKLTKEVSENFLMPEVCYKGESYKALAKNIYQKYQDKFIIKINPIINNKINDEKINLFFRNISAEYFLDIIKKDLEKSEIKIDYYSFESKFYKESYINHVLETLTNNDSVYKKDNCLWLKTSKYGDEKDRVLIKSDGSYTYLLPDIASHYDRMIRTKCDKFIDFFGADHHGYIKRLLIALSILGTKENMFVVEIIQMVKLVNDNKITKMSKRKGNVIWLNDLLELFDISLVKYIFCSKSKSMTLNFDFETLTKNNEKNPLFYSQYAAARCSNIIEKAIKIENLNYEINTDLLINEKEKNIIIELDLFNNVIVDSSKNMEPYIICDYIQRISKLFHSYYNSSRIIEENDLKLSNQRIYLIKAFSQVLKNSFDIIDIKFNKKMY